MDVSAMDISDALAEGENEGQTNVKTENIDEERLLYKHFCNCLYLGQWELASACAQILHSRKQPVHTFLHDVATHPFNRSVTAASVSSPCHLTWLCILQCQRLSASFQKEKVALSEFHLLMLELCPHIADIHLKEVYSYYKWVHSSASSGHQLTLSPGLLNFLQSLLSRQPSLCHTLISSLNDPTSNQNSKNNKALQMVYINTICALLDSLSQGDLDDYRKKAQCDKLYDILSLFQLTVNATQLPLRQMFSKVIENAQLNPNFISKTRVTSVLIGHQDLQLLEEFCKIDYEIETNRAVETYQACAELTEEQRWLLHLSSLSKVNTRWKMFLIFTMKMKRHVLEVIMETGLALIKCSMFTKLESLLEPRELHPLKPLMLLLGWTYCYSCTEGKQLLETLWTDKGTCEHPALMMGCNKLAYQIDLIQWCLEKARPLMTEETGGPQFSRAADLFKGLESHSVLYVLQHSTKLSFLDQQEVLDLLQKVPLQGHTDDKEKKKIKAVRFQELDDQSSEPVTSLDQKKDMAIYTGYCVLKNIMDAILFCAECSDRRLSEPVVSHSRRLISSRAMSDSSLDTEMSRSRMMSGDDTGSIFDDVNLSEEKPDIGKSDISVQKLYQLNVSQKLQQTKAYLSKLQPLTLRVEILENLFSLLFLTHEDIQETLVVSEYNSDEGDDNKSVKSLNLSTPASPVKRVSSDAKITSVTESVSQLASESSMSYDTPFEDKSSSSLMDTRQGIDMQKVGEALESIKSNIKQKVKVTGDEHQIDGLASSISENISSMSTSSSVNFDAHGFMANSYVVRDILAMLKECILDVSAAKFHIHGNKTDVRERYRSPRETVRQGSGDVDPSMEEALCHLLKSSVTMDTLQKRITQLERFTSEAHWRYQLVVDDHIPRSVGEVLHEIITSTGDSSDEEVAIVGIVGSKPRKWKRSVSDKRSGQVIHRSNGSAAPTTSRQVSMRVTRQHRGKIRPPKLVSLMLASPVTLLTMSIRKGQYTQTKQIIKLFKLEDRSETVEVYFSQAYQKACRSVQALTGKDVQSHGIGSNKSALQAVASAAAAGLATASVTDIADDILKFPTLPQMPCIEKMDTLPQNIAHNFKPSNLPLMILLDLMFTSAKTWEVCNHLMDTIKPYLHNQKQTNEQNLPATETKNSATVSKQRVNKIQTFQGLYKQIQAILYLGAEDEIPSKEQMMLAKVFQKNVQYFLCHSTMSLSAEKNKEHAALCQMLSKTISKVDEAFKLTKPISEKSRTTLESGSRSPGRSPGKSEVRMERSRSERPLIHHAMKLLIQLMERDVPATGVLSLINSKHQNSKQTTARRNYLLSVYEHCKELAYLVEESENSNKESHASPKNYFEVLEEGPLRILGRMMFLKKMAPAKLEKVASKLSLNLTHIIVYSCCVKVPSKRLPLLDVYPRQDIEKVAGACVYNSTSAVASSVSNPEELVRSLLTQLVHLMKHISDGCNAQGLFDRTCADLMTKHTDFYDIINKSGLLQSADLSQLDKLQSKCFYGNLQSLMTIHCFMNHFMSISTQATNEDSRSPILRPYSEMTITEQIMFLSTFSYRVGQLGVISLFDLKYQINRSGLSPPSEWGRTLEHRLHPLDELDPWYKLGPSSEPLLQFATTSCCVSSPPVQILQPDTVREQLAASLQEFLQHSIHIERDDNMVKIPELFLWYRRDFISPPQDLHGVSSVNDGLVAFIAEQLTGEKENDLTDIMRKEEKTTKTNTGKDSMVVEVSAIPVCKDFMVTFDFQSMTPARELHRSLSEAYNGSRDTNIRESDTYSLTPNTLEYIKSDCPLVATLVSLMCSDDIEEHLHDDAFLDDHFDTSGSPVLQDPSMQASLNRSRAASSMSLLDIRSYRYEKLTYEYPTLKRHLLNYIIPLAATENSDILKGDDPILKLLTSEIVERFKTNMLSLHESRNFRVLLEELLNELFTLRKWKEILQIIDSIPVNIVRQQTSLRNLHDFVVCCLIHTQCNMKAGKVTLTLEKSEEVMTLMHSMTSADRQAHELLSVHHKLAIDHNLDLFALCCNRGDVSTSLADAVHTKSKQINVFHRITECARNLQIKISLQRSELITEDDRIAAQKRHKILDQFTKWQTVLEWTRTSPRDVLALMVKAGDYETAKSWATLENLPDDIKLEIAEYHVTSLLTSVPANTASAFMILEMVRADDSGTCLSMCRKFVGVFSRQQDVMFIANYMLNQLTDSLDDTEKDRLTLIHIGSRMILCMPEAMHLEYSHLVSSPKYILEQLLMNMKPELAGKIFLMFKDEFDLVLNPVNKFSVEQFNAMVALYAKKALEFTVVQYLDEKDRSFSTRTSSSTDTVDIVDSHRASPQLRHSPYQKRRSEVGPKLAASAPPSTGGLVSMATSSVTKEKFVMPTEAPSREHWIPDTATTVCMVCEVERFSMFNRRHHCRRCGRVVCAACSENVTPIKGINARTCDDCYRQIFKSSDSGTTARPSVHDIYPHQHLSDASASGSQRSSFPNNPVSSAIQEELSARSLSEVFNHSHTAWKLHMDEEYNINLREDFYFEQAPSTSLCISILNLHSDGRECGRLILGLCDNLSKFLKPLAPGIPNPEVDYNLIMSMMKYLLFHAKIKFTQCGYMAGMGQCDVYQGLLDLLGLLVVDNFRDLPSLEELKKTDSIRRLRDKLIEDERLPLAIEVSTKCGLDPTGVWVSWGMMCLQSGDFTGAREKFSKSLKPQKDRNVCTPVSKVLSDIVECLEGMPAAGSMEIQVLLQNPGSMKNLIYTPSSTFYEETSMDSQQFQECVYYLRTYGTYLTLVDFHRRHGYYMKAVQYILDHRCSIEVYIEGLLKPSIESGELGRLTDQMLLIDPSLEKWSQFLTASCRYLVKHRLHHVLYDFQIFMKDFIRAGMTCFTYFYQEGTQSYLDLSHRINYLFIAQQHMQAYLDPTNWGNVQHPLSQLQRQGSWEESNNKSEAGSIRLVKSQEDVSRYIKTIALQIEITKYFQACFINGQEETLATVGLSGNSSKIPTLFGSQQVRNDLAIMLLMNGENLDSSFSLAWRVIKEYKLGGVGIFTHVAREMAKGHYYDTMRALLRCIEKTELCTEEVMDEILGACLLMVADDPNEAKEAENIIKMLRKEANKINAYILCGKLRAAYLMAVKQNRTDDVRRILRAAKSMGQSAVVNICNKWLEQNKY